MELLIGSIIRTTKELSYRNIPIDIIEKICLDAFKPDKMYVLESSGCIKGDEGCGEYSVVICISPAKEELFKFLRKKFIFSNDQEYIDFWSKLPKTKHETVILDEHEPDHFLPNTYEEIIDSLIETNIYRYEKKFTYESFKIKKTSLC